MSIYVNPYSAAELIGLYDDNDGDWCKIARAVERRYIEELESTRAALKLALAANELTTNPVDSQKSANVDDKAAQ